MSAADQRPEPLNERTQFLSGSIAAIIKLTDSSVQRLDGGPHVALQPTHDGEPEDELIRVSPTLFDLAAQRVEIIRRAHHRQRELFNRARQLSSGIAN